MGRCRIYGKCTFYNTLLFQITDVVPTIATVIRMELRDHQKPVIQNKEVMADVRGEDLSQKVLSRIFGVKRTFVDVSFKQAELSNVYFRNCIFINCDFTGASISASNLRGSNFERCDFRYSTWEHTILDESFLDKCLPSEENLARDLVRSLRVNFTQTGNYEAVNKAASIEVALTGEHLFQAAYSKQSHYRSKHKGWDRVIHGLRHAKWKALDILWGNGESIFRILTSGLAVLLLCALSLSWGQPQLLFSEAFFSVASAFWGIDSPATVTISYLVILTITRFTLFGLFMAVLVKRLSRR